LLPSGTVNGRGELSPHVTIEPAKTGGGQIIAATITKNVKAGILKLAYGLIFAPC
jgi:hypothetical protein